MKILSPSLNTLRTWRRQGRHRWLTWPAERTAVAGRRAFALGVTPLVIRKARCVPHGIDADRGAEMVTSPYFHNVIYAIQVPSEIASLVRVVQSLRPRRIMEIGTAGGGTLFLFSRAADEQAMLISLDLPGGQFGGGYPQWKSRVYREMALPGQRVELLRGDSHDPRSLQHVKALLAGEPLDLLFIDGDHTYAGVTQDMEMYGPLVRPGGVIAFHDINDHAIDDSDIDPAAAGGDVPRFWHELAASRNVREFIARPHYGYGIGVVNV